MWDHVWSCKTINLPQPSSLILLTNQKRLSSNKHNMTINSASQVPSSGCPSCARWTSTTTASTACTRSSFPNEPGAPRVSRSSGSSTTTSATCRSCGPSWRPCRDCASSRPAATRSRRSGTARSGATRASSGCIWTTTGSASWRGRRSAGCPRWGSSGWGTTRWATFRTRRSGICRLWRWVWWDRSTLREVEMPWNSYYVIRNNYILESFLLLGFSSDQNCFKQFPKFDENSWLEFQLRWNTKNRDFLRVAQFWFTWISYRFNWIVFVFFFHLQPIWEWGALFDRSIGRSYVSIEAN